MSDRGRIESADTRGLNHDANDGLNHGVNDGAAPARPAPHLRLLPGAAAPRDLATELQRAREQLITIPPGDSREPMPLRRARRLALAVEGADAVVAESIARCSDPLPHAGTRLDACEAVVRAALRGGGRIA